MYRTYYTEDRRTIRDPGPGTRIPDEEPSWQWGDTLTRCVFRHTHCCSTGLCYLKKSAALPDSGKLQIVMYACTGFVLCVVYT